MDRISGSAGYSGLLDIRVCRIPGLFLYYFWPDICLHIYTQYTVCWTNGHSEYGLVFLQDIWSFYHIGNTAGYKKMKPDTATQDKVLIVIIYFGIYSIPSSDDIYSCRSKSSNISLVVLKDFSSDFWDTLGQSVK